MQGTTCHCLLQSPTPAEPASLKTICSVTRSPRPWSCMNCDGSCMNCDVICAQQHLFGNTKRDGPCYPCVNALLQTLKGTSSVLLQLNPMTRTGVINLSGCSMCTAENWIKYKIPISFYSSETLWRKVLISGWRSNCHEQQLLHDTKQRGDGHQSISQGFLNTPRRTKKLPPLQVQITAVQAPGHFVWLNTLPGHNCFVKRTLEHCPYSNSQLTGCAVQQWL